QASVLEVVRVERNAVEQIKDALFFRLRGQLLPIVCLEKELALASCTSTSGEALYLVVLKADDKTLGLAVDAINDAEEIVVKPLGPGLKNVTVFAGATVMGDGTVVLILDVLGLAQPARV